MDKSWMKAHITTKTFKDGVKSFIDFARIGAIKGEISCPCNKCGNDGWFLVDVVHHHLLRHGFCSGYTLWTLHGELDTKPPISQPTSVLETSPVIDDIRGLVRDALGVNSLDSNSEESSESRLEGDIEGDSEGDGEGDSEGGNEEDSEEDIEEDNEEDIGERPRVAPNSQQRKPGDEDIRYKKLLEECEKELYPGCKYSNLSFTLRLYHIKCMGGISNKSFSMILELIKDAFPHLSSLPSSSDEAKKLTRDLGLGYEKIHVCPNDCMLYSGVRKSQQSCHICNASRYKSDPRDENGESSKALKSNKPAKVLRYFPLIPRLKRLYMSEKTAKDMRWHDMGLTKDGKLRHPADGNDRDQLIKDAAGLCTRFMTLLLKQPNLCPIEAKDWREVRTRCGVRLMAELRRKFCISQGTKIDSVLFKIFNQKYRALKYRMKYKLYGSVKSRLDEANNIGVDDAHELEYTEDQILNALDLVDAPSKVHDHQWELYKAQLRSSKSRKLSEIGKKARGEKLHTHRTGAKSFARVRYEFKSKNKRSPLFVEAFEIEHQATDGSYVEDASRELVDQANKEISRKILELGCPEEEITNEKRAAIDREVWIELKGPEGEALGYGAGVTKSQVTSFSNELRKMRGENFMNSNYVHKLLVQTKSQTSIIESQNRTIVSLNKTVETLNKTVESQRKKVEDLENTVGEFREELKVFQIMFQRAYGSSDMCFPTQTGSHEDQTGYGKEKNMQSSWKN